MSKIAALLTRMSIPPASLTTASTMASIEALLGHVELDREGPAADRVRRLLRVLLEDVGDRDARALVGIALGDRRARCRARRR